MFFVDHFNRPNGSDIGRLWEDESAGGDWDIVSNEAENQVAISDFKDNMLLRPTSESFADGIAMLDFSVTSGGAPLLAVRAQGTDNNTMYILIWAGTVLRLQSVVDGVQANIGSTATVGAISAGAPYRFYFKIEGTSLTGTLRNLTSGSLMGTATATDSEAALVGTGKNGFSIASSGQMQANQFIAVDNPDIDEFMLRRHDRFDGTLAAWTLDTTGGTVAIAVRDNDEKMVLDDTVNGSIVSAKRFFAEGTGKYIVEADMKVEASAKGIMQLLDTGSNVIASVALNGPSANNCAFDTDNDTPTNFGWTENTYKKISLLVDPVANTIRCHDHIVSWVSAAKSYTGATITDIRFITDSVATGEFVVDEVRVFEPVVGCLGDSNTAGTDTWDPNPENGARTGVGEDENHSYPFQYSSLFSGSIAWTINFGVNGATIANGDGRVQRLIDLGCEHIVVALGTNDIIADTPIATMKSGIESIVAKINAGGLSATLCTIPPWNGASGAQNATMATFNTWIETIAISNGFQFANVHDDLEGATPDEINPAYDLGDGIHFNTAGLTVKAQTIANGELTGGFLSGVIADKNDTTVDCSVYNTHVAVLDKDTRALLGSTLTVAADGTYSITGLTPGIKYLVAYWFEGTYAVTGDVDIAGAELKLAT